MSLTRSTTLAPNQRWRARLGVLTTALGLGASLCTGLAAASAQGSNPATPGTFTGQGFDQCLAPSQSAMNAWRAHSPYRAVGIYISGNSRACRTQPNLNSSWVSTQIANGWHLLPITMGPQASCSTRFPRYGANIDPTISSSSTDNYARARQQGAAEADKTVTAAKALGISSGSVMYYDLEGFDSSNSGCRTSALNFLSAWTRELHRQDYYSGVYSSASSGIRMLDDARVNQPGTYKMPDQIWIADWDGRENTSSSYVRPDGWQNGRRLKQYRGGHNETYGGVTINSDTDYLALRQPTFLSAPGPTQSPSPTSNPTPATFSMTDPKCTPASISKRRYLFTTATRNSDSIVALQCLLKQHFLYTKMVTGRWDAMTTSAVNSWQRKVNLRVQSGFSRPDWVSLTSAGSSASVHQGSSGADVVRLQRALNAAEDDSLNVTGYFGAATQRAVTEYQQRVLGASRTSVDSATWTMLHAGRRD